MHGASCSVMVTNDGRKRHVTGETTSKEQARIQRNKDGRGCSKGIQTFEHRRLETRRYKSVMWTQTLLIMFEITPRAQAHSCAQKKKNLSSNTTSCQHEHGTMGRDWRKVTSSRAGSSSCSFWLADEIRYRLWCRGSHKHSTKGALTWLG